MDSGVIVSHEHIPSAPVLAPKIHSEDTKEDTPKVTCEGPSTVPSADVDSGKGRKPVGAPTQDQTPTDEANVDLDAGKDQRSDQKGNDKTTETTVTDKVSSERELSAPVLALQIPVAANTIEVPEKDEAMTSYMTERAERTKAKNIFEANKTDMEDLADKAILDAVKVSHKHVIFAPLLAPQTPPEDIIASIDQIYREEVTKTARGGQEAIGPTEGFFVQYRDANQETRTDKEGVKVSNEHQNSAPVLALQDTSKIFAKSAPPTILKGILEDMSDQAKKALAAKQKVSNGHKTTLPGLAPQDTFKARLDEEIDVILINMPPKQKRPLSPAALRVAGAIKKTHKEEEDPANGGDN